uniref:AMP-binding domain-containing protein n=1 Tax=Meloidogyne hapla TaxID=6305 RepID=A0A1I8B5R8_MELHA
MPNKNKKYYLDNIPDTFQCTEIYLNSSKDDLIAKTFSFSNLMDIAQTILNLLKVKNKIIGVVIEKSALLVGVLIGIIKSNNSFIIFEQISPEFTQLQIKRFNITKLIYHANLFKQFSKIFPNSRQLGENLYFYDEGMEEKTNEKNENNFEDEVIAYAIQTSGSTGESKIVHVPYSSIMPNIDDFIQRFSLTKNSSILFSTSLGFDPSMVELFISLSIGSQLIIPPKEIIGGISELILRRQKINFVQTTPALLQCLSQNCLNLIFGPTSSIDFLLIGGENFPLNFISRYLNYSTKTRIFNIYGITEVSCWASCFEFTFENFRQFSNDSIPIGNPLLETNLKINKEGLLLIYGRKCFVNFLRDKEEPTNTGDIAFIKTINNSEEICVKSRYKPQSQLPSIEQETIILNLFPQIIFAKLLFSGACKFLFLKYLDGISTISTQQILNKLPKRLWPTRIFWNFPNFLTSNGKIDETKLLEYTKTNYYNKFTSLLDFLSKNYNIPLTLSSTNLSSSLRYFGIGSLEAVEICFFLENSSSKFKDFGDKMQFILDENTTLENFLKVFENSENKIQKEFVENGKEKCLELLKLSEINKTFMSKECWNVDLGKCIDGTPVYSDGVVYAASHLGVFKGISLTSGSTIFNYLAENDRFEAGCAVNQHYIAIGGFSGNLLVFEKNSNRPLRKIKCFGEIRMTPIFDEEFNIIWGDYFGIIWNLNIQTGSVKQLFNCNNEHFGALRTSPLLFDNLLIFGTLNGILFAIDKISGQLYWKKQLDSPLFAQPITFLDDCSFCIALSVKGGLYCFRITNGELISQINLNNALTNNKNIPTFFDSPTALPSPNINYFLISAGKAHLFLIKYNKHNNTFILIKQIILPNTTTSIVRRPLALNGDVYVLNSNETLISNKQQSFAHLIIDLNNAETFGHPLILPKNKKEGEAEIKTLNILIGTRKNLLHCFVFNYQTGDKKII